MAISSQDVIRTVSKKLKYYIDVKRLEDGFDLSGVDCPKLDHPPTKARSTLQYDGLHDRPLKHYFSPKNVKQILTQFKTPIGRAAREKEIRQQLERYLRRYQFADKTPRKGKSSSTQSLHTDHKHHRRGRPSGSAKSYLSGSQPSVLADNFYTQTKHSKKLKPEASGGFGVGLKKRRGQRGGQTGLRSVPTTSVGRNETDRLMNLASRLLATTEIIDVNKPPVKSEAKSGEEDKKRGAPRSFEGHKGRHKIYTYDINGRRILVKPKPESEDDSAYHSPSPNYLTINGEQVDDQVMPTWLRKEVGRGAPDPSRPHSSYGAPRPTPPAEDSRPYSAMAHRSVRRRSSSDASTSSSIKPQPKNGWDSEQAKERKASPSPPAPRPKPQSARQEMAVQTGGELLRHYEPTEQIIHGGEQTEYKVHVVTGSGLGASTKADVKLSLIGDKGRTKEIFLADSSTHKIKFQKGQEDIFKLNTSYVGTLRKIAIGHDRQELGFGWYLSKVLVKDMERLVQYVIPCERWLSARESDERTFREFPVDYSSTFSIVPEAPVREPSPTPRQEEAPVSDKPVEDDRSEATSHTSLATVYSDRSDRSGSSRVTPPRRGRAKSSRSSSSTSVILSSTSANTSSSDSYCYTSSDEETPAKLPQKEEPKPKPLPARPQIRRKDTFFDQKPVGPDYGSVIDSISHTTEQDTLDRQDSLDKKEPGYVAKNPVGKELTLKEEDEETGVLDRKDVVDSEDDWEEEKKVGTRLSMPDPPTPEVAKEVYLDGFKAGIQAARNRQEVAVSSSSSDSESSESESGLESRLTIHEAARQGDLGRVKKILDLHPEKKNETDERGWTPVHIVASAGHTELLKWLAINNANLNQETPTSYTAMHLAAMHGHTNTMMVLYAMGAKLTSKSVDHQTALHVAAMGGHLESVKWLVVNRVPIDMPDNLGRTPFDLAEEYRHEEVANFLRSCQEEQARPGSSLSLIRSASRQRRRKRATVNERSRASNRSIGLEAKSSARSSASTDTSSDTDSSFEAPVWQNNMRPTTPGKSTTDDEAQSKKTVKHDEELMEKKHMYQEQQRRLSEKNVSFLDDIRNEAL